MDREDIEEAIEVLEDASAEMLMETGDENYYSEAINALRQALETEKQESVAWRSTSPDGKLSNKFACKPTEGNWVEPLYTAPPKREWVGLTDEEIITHFQTNVDIGSLLSFVDGARYAEAKLKERNG
jgi:hypothetical protein